MKSFFVCVFVLALALTGCGQGSPKLTPPAMPRVLKGAVKAHEADPHLQFLVGKWRVDSTPELIFTVKDDDVHEKKDGGGRFFWFRGEYENSPSTANKGKFEGTLKDRILQLVLTAPKQKKTDVRVIRTPWGMRPVAGKTAMVQPRFVARFTLDLDGDKLLIPEGSGEAWSGLEKSGKTEKLEIRKEEEKGKKTEPVAPIPYNPAKAEPDRTVKPEEPLLLAKDVLEADQEWSGKVGSKEATLIIMKLDSTSVEVEFKMDGTGARRYVAKLRPGRLEFKWARGEKGSYPTKITLGFTAKGIEVAYQGKKGLLTLSK